MSMQKIQQLNYKPVILVVDDQIEIRKLLQFYLKDGYTAVLKENAEQGIDYLTSHKVDLVMMDINLGAGMSGIEAVKKIRRRAQYQTLPIVMLTASTLKQNQTDSVRAGCNGYLIKPVYKKEVIATVSKELGIKRAPF